MKSVICSSSGGSVRRRPAERVAGVAVRLLRHPARPLEAVLADVGELAVALVAALRLAQRVLGARHVEDVVDDLEEDPELGREGTEVL